MRKSVLLPILAILLALVSTASAQLKLVPVTTFGPNGDGSIRPGDRSYLTTGGFERGMAFNPTTGHLLLVHRDTTAHTFTVYILDANTGADLGTMSVQDVTAGNTDFKVNLIRVGADGSIYAGNLSSSTSPPQFVLYRAASESDTLSLVYGDDPSSGTYTTNSNNRRWGDTLAIRGTGTGTQVVLGTQAGNEAAILTPTDPSLTTFVATTLFPDSSTNTGQLGYGNAFGNGNTFWAKSASSGGNPLILFNFNLGTGAAARQYTYSTAQFPGRVGPLEVNVSSNLLAGIESITGKDRVRLYDISNPAVMPALLDVVSWPTNAAENNLFAGSLAFGTNATGDQMLWALDTDNGLMAYSIVSSNHLLAPTIFLQPLTQLAAPGSNVTLVVGADGIPAPTYYQWYFNNTNLVANATNSTYTLTNVSAAANNGSYSVVVSNSSGVLTSSTAKLTVVASSAGLIAYEPFDYTADQLLNAASPLWTTNGNGNDARVAAGNLSLSGLMPPIGNSMTNGGAGAGMRYTLPSSVIDGDLYYSFIMRVDSVGANFTAVNSFIAAFDDGASSTTYEARLVPRTNTIAGQYNLGVAKVGTTLAAQAWATNNFVEGETVFIVCRYSFNPAQTTDDQVDMWIDPSASDFGSATAPPSTLTAPITGNDISAITQFTFRQNTAANTPAAMTFDELRIGRTWASVTPPASVSLRIALSGNNAVLSWPTNSSPDFVLTSINSLVGDPDGWEPVGTPVVVQGTNNTVTVSASTGRKFYRLAR